MASPAVDGKKSKFKRIFKFRRTEPEKSEERQKWGVTEWRAKVENLERERETMREGALLKEIMAKDQYIKYLEDYMEEQDKVVVKAEGLSDKLEKLKDEYRSIEELEKSQLAGIRELEGKLDKSEGEEECSMLVCELKEDIERHKEDLKNVNDEKKHLAHQAEQREFQLTKKLEDQVSCAAQLRKERDTIKVELNRVAEVISKATADLEGENRHLQLRIKELEESHLLSQLLACQREAKELRQQLESERLKSAADLERVESENKWLHEQLQSSPEHVVFHPIRRADVVVNTRPIGSGAWGTINSGRFCGCKVAVKQPHPHIMHESTVERMKREASNMARVHHPNLVTFIGANFDDDGYLPIIVIELMEANLRDTYKKKKFNQQQMTSIFKDVAYALHYLHSLREPLIHRDLSSPNVLLNSLPNNRFLAKVSDFGSSNLAKFAITAAEGAPIYSAPESAQVLDASRPKPKQTVKMDTYSYGVLLCEVVNRRLPADRDCWDKMLTVARQWEQVYALIVECTKFDPAQRPTMRKVINHFQHQVELRH